MSENQAASAAAGEGAQGDNQEFVTVILDGQWFGIPVLTVQDVLGPRQIARIPISPPEVAGSLNLRGRIVTAIDPRVRLLYSLLIDSVGEVLNLPAHRYERNPATLDSRWRDISAGIYRLDDRLMVVLDVARLLDFGMAKAA
jgi:purine-binding chemotaxis protein CheW